LVLSTFLRDLLLRGRRLKEDQQGSGIYVDTRRLVSSDGPNGKLPPERPIFVDKATKIANIAEEMSTPWMLSRREWIRRDEILEKLKNHVPLSEDERNELARLIVKKEVGE